MVDINEMAETLATLKGIPTKEELIELLKKQRS